MCAGNTLPGETYITVTPAVRTSVRILYKSDVEVDTHNEIYNVGGYYHSTVTKFHISNFTLTSLVAWSKGMRAKTARAKE